MSYTCSAVGGGCGKSFALLSDFDHHMWSRDETGRSRCKCPTGRPHCKCSSALVAEGWQRDSKGVWRSMRSLAHRRRVRDRTERRD